MEASHREAEAFHQVVVAFHQVVEAFHQVVAAAFRQEALHQVVEVAFHRVLLVASAADLATHIHALSQNDEKQNNRYSCNTRVTYHCYYYL